MRLSALAGNAFAVLLMSVVSAAGIAGATPNSEPVRLTGPLSHDNLAVYFVHGASKAGPVPLTLQDALAQGSVRLSETGNVNTLAIENLGDQAVFAQAGDVVKGGRQDRTLTVSLLLPPKSGRVPIASFCVEHGRWSARGAEDARSFSASAAAVPSREMKLAMQAPMPAVISACAGSRARTKTNCCSKRRGPMAGCTAAIWRSDFSSLSPFYGERVASAGWREPGERQCTAPHPTSSLTLGCQPLPRIAGRGEARLRRARSYDCGRQAIRFTGLPDTGFLSSPA